jgi:Rps23 Pro-64 3,4-dihydroxylase Tpa1-like proline 4-hydroxylase
MKTSFAGPGIAIIEDFYDEADLKLIWKELDYLNLKDKFLSPTRTAGARDAKGNLIKNNKGLFLDEFYKNRNFSNILNLNRKVWMPAHELEKDNFNFRYLISSNQDATLVSYYENEDYYKKHLDSSVYTILTYFYKEPKKFSGGNLKLLDYDIEIEVKNNMVIYIPSILWHEVTPIVMEQEFANKGFGRYCISQFLFIENKDG